MDAAVIGITTGYWPREGKPGLVAVPESYIQAVMRAGGIPLLFPFPAPVEAVPLYLQQVQGVLFIGGGDIGSEYTHNPQGPLREVQPDRDRFEFALMQQVLERGVPFLAVCRGIQLLNVALGGSLYVHLPRDYPGVNHDQGPRRYERVHEVQVVPESRLARILGGTRFRVNSIHHQGLNRLAPGLRVAARAEDGLVEAVEVEGHPFGIGVQWHPELLAPQDPAMARLFTALVEATRQYRREGGGTGA